MREEWMFEKDVPSKGQGDDRGGGERVRSEYDDEKVKGGTVADKEAFSKVKQRKKRKKMDGQEDYGTGKKNV